MADNYRNIMKHKKTILLAAELICLGLACILLADVWNYRAGWHDAMMTCNASVVRSAWDYNFTVTGTVTP